MNSIGRYVIFSGRFNRKLTAIARRIWLSIFIKKIDLNA